jgi:hypothetical protein
MSGDKRVFGRRGEASGDRDDGDCGEPSGGVGGERGGGEGILAKGPN